MLPYVERAVQLRRRVCIARVLNVSTFWTLAAPTVRTARVDHMATHPFAMASYGAQSILATRAGWPTVLNIITLLMVSFRANLMYNEFAQEVCTDLARARANARPTNSHLL